MTSRVKALFCKLSIFMLACITTVATAQVQGNKTVYNSSGHTAPSTAWIDASAYWTSGGAPDPCTILQSILSSGYGSTTYPNGAVIDARGLYNSHTPSAGLSCLSTETPFDSLSGLSSAPPPTTILLPPVAIAISKTWIVPNNFKIVGEGKLSILAASGTMTDMIDMGGEYETTGLCDFSSGGTTPCSGIAIEHLQLNGNSVATNGIVNQWAQAQSYVNDVLVTGVLVKGLWVGAPTSGTAGATNSGPYTNIYYLGGGGSSCDSGVSGTCPICADVEVQTQGLHGFTCIGDAGASAKGNAAIYVNASNNTVEDVHIEAFWDGVEVGDVSGTVGNITVENVDGAGNSTGVVTNTVHICGAGGTCLVSPTAVKDVTIFQVKNSTANKISVVDDMTGTSLGNSPTYSMPVEGMYALGDTLGTKQFSRFNTDPAAPTWGIGNTSTGSKCTTPGALYSNTQGISNSKDSVYVCIYNGGSPQWRSIEP
jgi:hypothetical protein